MGPLRIITMLALALLPALAAAPVTAQEARGLLPQGVTLRAAIGGAVPYARKESYLVATLGGEKSGKIAFAGSLPLSSLSRPVFETRQLYVLGGGVALGRVGAARLSLDGQIATAAERPQDEPRPLLGLARLRLVF
ncbi:hypothetical protein [Pseudoroseomonas cervicalis]|uniref:hypothetical protein n=1 Tax=Teichococcus cervicalis TaxID=204525 RepID=UPI002781369A|nr:hypothetical protein [Pseudoroseomonas cervicalis]MDQ1079926.1 hypothetical protein [Pseudoroseomonas cervicalis]